MKFLQRIRQYRQQTRPVMVEVDCPEWDCVVGVHRLGALDYAGLAAIEDDSQRGFELLARSICDPSHPKERPFDSEEGRDELYLASPGLIAKLCEAATALNEDLTATVEEKKSSSSPAA